MKFCYLLCSKAGTELPLNIKKTANKVQYFTTNVLLKFNRRRKDRKESFQKFKYGYSLKKIFFEKYRQIFISQRLNNVRARFN